MKTTPRLCSCHCRKKCPIFPGFLIWLGILFTFPYPGQAQQTTLPCNIPTPWVPDSFDVIVNFDSDLLACWDGDFGCSIPGNHQPPNVVDDDLSNFASGEILLGGQLTLSVEDPVHTYSAGNFAGFVISSDLLDISVIGGLEVRTYNNGVLQETYSDFDLLGLNLNLFLDPYTVGFITSQDFDEVEISIGTLLGLLDFNVHYAVLERFCMGDTLACNTETAMNAPAFPVVINYEETGASGINLGDVDNPENAISASTSDFASLNNLANVAGSLFISVQEQVVNYPAGTFVGFDIENLTLAELDVLNFMTVTSYLDGVEQESVTGNALLVGVPLLTGFDRQTVGFVTTTAVDEVKLTLSQPLNVTIGTTRVYSAVFKQFCEGPPLPCNVFTPVFNPDYPVYIETDHTGLTGAVCVGCTVEDPGHVIDDDPDNFAQIDITAGVATIGSISVRDALTDYPANTFAGFRIENIGLVDLGVLEGVLVRTYLNGSFVESAEGEDLIVSAGTDLLVNQGEFFAGFLSTQPYDEVRISLFNVGAVNIGTTLVYEAVMGAFCEADIDCDTTYYLNSPEFPVYIDWELTGLDGVACALCEVEDPDEVITASNMDYATITIPVGVLNTGSIAVRDALYTYPPGTVAGFVIEDVNDVLQADLFGSLTISTYLDGMLQEAASGVNLIDAEVLILFINPDAGIYNVGFETSLPFDEIRITVGALASVINIVRVYGAFVDTRNSSGGNGGLNCPDPPVAMDDQAVTDEDTPVNIDVLANDSDEDSDLGLPDIIEGPSNGMVSVNPVDSTVMYTPDPDFVGLDTFRYEICDAGMPPLCDSAYVFVTVEPVTDTITEHIPEDSTLTICADTFTVFTTGPETVTICGDADNGDVTLDSLCLMYTPDMGYNGPDTICVVVCDDAGFCDTTIIIVIVDPYSDPPIAEDDAAQTPEDTPVVIDVLDNDSDPDGPLDVPLIVDGPDWGDVVVNADSTVTYTPDPDFVGVDSFTYSICDVINTTLCDTALVVVTVLPRLDTIYETIPEDSMLTACADELTTFTQPATSISVCGDPQEGNVMVNGVCATYTPDEGYNGQDTFCLVVCDPSNPLLCDTTIVIVTVTPVNDPPVAMDDVAVTDEDTPVNIDVLANDSDEDSDLGLPDIIEGPSNGMVSVNPVDSTVTYTPDPDFVGLDTFRYEICDAGMPPLCDSAYVFVTVEPVTDTITEHIPEDSTLTICADTFTVFTTGPETLTICGNPDNGDVTLDSFCLMYTPDMGYNGPDTICVVVCDDAGFCDTTIIIVIVDPYSDPPIAEDDAAQTPEDTPVVIDVLDNDSDPDSPLDVPLIVDGPDWGDVMVNADSTVTYTPDSDFVGVDSFTYSICDVINTTMCDTAIVVVTVLPQIDTLYETIPEDSMLTACADELTTFTQPATSISVCGDPQEGVVMVNGVCATYTPDEGYNGQDTFCLVVCDPSNPLLCDTTIVIVTVTPVNDPPVAVDDMAVTDEDTPVNIDVLANDSDEDSDLGLPDIIEGPSNGMVSVNPVDSTVTYTPDPDFVGLDTFRYEICDAGMPPLCDSAFVFVTVQPVTDTITEHVPEDSTLTVCADTFTVFTTGPETVTICGDPDNGDVTVDSLCLMYMPDPGYNGPDTICVVVCDDAGFCDTTIIIVIVDPYSDPPIAEDDVAQTPEDTPVVIDVLDNDSDPDSPLGIPVIIDEPDWGDVVVNADSTVTYTPDPDFVGVDTFRYELCDVVLTFQCDPAVVVVTVLPRMDTIYETIPEDSMLTACADELTTFTQPATSISVCGDPQEGDVMVNGVCATYTPDEGYNGQDTFCLVVCDPSNPLLCDTTIVIVTVTPVNDPPVAVDDMAVTDEDTPVHIDVLANDSDEDSPLGIPILTDDPTWGDAVLNPLDSTYTYTPDPGFVGVDSFMYAICDNGAIVLCDTALVVVTVLPQIDTVYVTIPYDSSTTQCADSLTTFTTAATSIGLCGAPMHGTIDIAGACSTYSPDSAYSGQDTFCLVVCDPLTPALCDTTIVVVTILPPPCVTIQTWVYLEGSAIDVDGDPEYAIPMRTTLNDLRLLPGQCYVDPFLGLKCSPPGQPYSQSPWNYPGTEGDGFDSGGDPMQGDAGYPPTVVDWILVSLREHAHDPGPLCEAAALLHEDGTVEFVDTFTCCGIDLEGYYYIVIEHRNHLIVMSEDSAQMTNGLITYDFRSQQSYQYDPLNLGLFARQKEILPAIFAMYAGNGEQNLSGQADTDINFDDRGFWEMENGSIGDYRRADYNLNGDTNFNDRLLWETNNGNFTSVPRQ